MSVLVRSATTKLDIEVTRVVATNTRPKSWRHKLGDLLDNPSSSTAASGVFSIVIAAITASVAVFYIQTAVEFTPPDGNHLLQRGDPLAVCEAICVFIFTAEVSLRIIVGTLDVRRLLLLDAYFWVDLLSIVPFYAELVLTSRPPDCTIGIAANLTLVNGSVVAAPRVCRPAELPQYLRVMQLLRLMRILKLMRHYVDMRVLMLAWHTAWRALLVPGFAMLLSILILSGALWLLQGTDADESPHSDGFESLWCVFWIVSTLGYDGPMGNGGGVGQCIIAIAIITGLILTTMPITVIGQAFGDAWRKKELITLGMRVQDLLVKRGISVHDFKQVFDELDADGSGELDWAEFKEALDKLSIRLPVHKMRELFESLDDDHQGQARPSSPGALRKTPAASRFAAAGMAAGVLKQPKVLPPSSGGWDEAHESRLIALEKMMHRCCGIAELLLADTLRRGVDSSPPSGTAALARRPIALAAPLASGADVPIERSDSVISRADSSAVVLEVENA